MTITLTEAPGALVRVLGLVERRGFRVVEAKTSGPKLVRIDVESTGRDVVNLARQIEKLWDVEGVRLAGS